MKVLANIDMKSMDIIFAEPCIEALCYEYGVDQISVKTHWEYFPLFENHPLVESLVDLNDRACSGYDFTVNILAPDASPLELIGSGPIAENIAHNASLYLRRSAPKIFINSTAEQTDNVVLITGEEIYESCYREALPMRPNFKLVSKDWLNLNEHAGLELLKTAALVVGRDNLYTQAAAAMDNRVIMWLNDEIVRSTPNVIPAFSKKDMMLKVDEVLYERRYPNYMNTGNAADWIKYKAKQYLKSNFLDVGCSQWPIPNSIPVDKDNRHILENAEDGAFAGIFSSHCLEHISDWESEIKLWHRVLRMHGTLVMYLPHPECEPWRAFTGSWVGAEHVWNPEPVTFTRALHKLGFQIIEYSSRPDPLWSFYVVARKM